MKVGMLPRRSSKVWSLTAAFRFRKRPGKQRQAQINDGGIERIDGLLQLHTEAVLGIEPTRHLNQGQGEILVDAPVAPLVGVGQGAPGDAATDAEVVQLARMGPQTGFDVAQVFPVGQLGEHPAQIRVEVREGERRVLARIPRHTAPERGQRQMLHQLGEHPLARMHSTTPEKIRKFPTH